MTTTTHARPAAPSADAQRPQLTVTDKDLARLEAHIAGASITKGAREAAQLEAELSRARVVPEHAVPPNVVTMGSSLVIEDVQAGTRRALSVVFPEEADASAGRISVFAPIGAAVIGLEVGAEIDWPLPGGRTTRLRVLAITHQPQAASARG